MRIRKALSLRAGFVHLLTGKERDNKGSHINLRVQFCNSPLSLFAQERTCFSLIYLETEFPIQRGFGCVFFLDPDVQPIFPKGVWPAFLEFSGPAPLDLPVTVRTFPALTSSQCSTADLARKRPFPTGHVCPQRCLPVSNQRRPAQVWRTI